MLAVRGPGGQRWGEIDEREKVYKTRRTLQHYCYKYKGFGIQKVLLDRLVGDGIKYIYITYNDEEYRASINKWLNHGIVDTLREEDGKQVFLPLHLMINTGMIEGVRKIEEFV